MLVKAELEDGDRFFSQFPYLDDLTKGDFLSALNGGIALLKQCAQVAPASYASIGKGTPFYWLGIAAYHVHDYQTATFFFDAAVSEDLRKNHDPIKNSSPALRFIQVEANEPAQAALPLVQLLHKRIDLAITAYNSRTGSSQLDIQSLQQWLLRRAVLPGGDGLRTLATTFLSYFLEWDYRSTLLGVRPERGTAEPFFVHLFKGCLLFESLLKANPKRMPSKQTLGKILQELHQELGIPSANNIGGTTLPLIVAELPASDKSVAGAITFAGKIRNTLGHDLGWVVHLNNAQYEELADCIAAACLHAVATLYS
jgi:hypothetical protein